MHISIYCKLYTDEFTTVLINPADDKRVKWLFYAAVHSLEMDQSDPKQVAYDVLKHYCTSKEVRAFVGLQCNNNTYTYSFFLVLNFMLPASRPNFAPDARKTWKVEQDWVRRYYTDEYQRNTMRGREPAVHLPQDKDKWRILVHMVKNTPGHIKYRKFLDYQRHLQLFKYDSARRIQ